MKKKAKNDLGEATRASVRKEMAKPRMAKSARIAERNLDTTRGWVQVIRKRNQPAQ
jgi:hypothetical protein